MVEGCVRAARCLYPELSAAGSGNRKLKKLTFLVFPLPRPPVHDIQPHITMRPHTSTTAFRPFLRRSAGRRFASTNSESGQRKAQSSDALGSVQKNAERAWEGTKRALGPVGERAGNLFGCEWFYLLLHKLRFSLHPVIILYFILCMAIESPSANPPPHLHTAYLDPLLYNLSVARAVLKQVYIAEALQPPTSLATIRSAYTTLWARASNLGYWRELAQNGELAKVGVYAVEAYGIFKVCVWGLFSFLHSSYRAELISEYA